MRIWFVNHYALPPQASGGPTRHLGLSRALRDRGHEVTIFASLFDHYTRTDHRSPGPGRIVVEDIDGVTYAWIRTPPYGGTPGRIRNMMSFAAGVSGRAASPHRFPDVVVGSSPHLLAPVAAQRIAKRHGAPFVLEVRDVWPQSLVDLGEMSPRHPAMVALGLIERRLYRSVDHVVVVPPGAIAHVIASGGHDGRVSHVPNGVDLSSYPKPVPPPPRQGRPFTLVYAGTVGIANGLHVVVDAAAELRRRGTDQILVRLVGHGPERNAIAEQADRLGVADLVKLEPAVRSDQVPALLASADACLLVLRPSPVFRLGVSPTKLFDYLAAGRAVLSVVDAPDDPSVLAGAGVRVAGGDGVGLADAIETLRALPAHELDAMGRRGRDYVERHHSFQSLAEQYEQLLIKVTAGRLGRVRR